LLRIDAIQRQGELGGIVAEVLDEELQGQHRWEWQEGAGGEDRQDVAEVGRQGGLEVLGGVERGVAGCDDSGLHDAQVLVEQDGVGGLAATPTASGTARPISATRKAEVSLMPSPR
jgi:general stress protein YciG